METPAVVVVFAGDARKENEGEGKVFQRRKRHTICVEKNVDGKRLKRKNKKHFFVLIRESEVR